VETEISSQEMEQKVIAAVSEAGFKIQPVR